MAFGTQSEVSTLDRAYSERASKPSGTATPSTVRKSSQISLWTLLTPSRVVCVPYTHQADPIFAVCLIKPDTP